MTPDLRVGNGDLIPPPFFFLFSSVEHVCEVKPKHACKCARSPCLCVAVFPILHMCLLARSHVRAVPVMAVYGGGN